MIYGIVLIIYVKIMKKLTILTLLMLSMGIVLTGCTSDTSDVEATDVVVEDVQEEVIADRNEYQFEFVVKWADGFEMSSKVYKKWDKSMTEYFSMIMEEDMPFIPKKSLIVDGTAYQEVEKDGKTFRFSMPGMEGEEDMFNLKEMSTVDKNLVVDTKKEKINGKKMTCYYIDDVVEGKGKSCLYKGIFAYGEFSENGVMDSVEISDYSDKVKDSIFAIPAADDILGAQDMMQLFQ